MSLFLWILLPIAVVAALQAGLFALHLGYFIAPLYLAGLVAIVAAHRLTGGLGARSVFQPVGLYVLLLVLAHALLIGKNSKATCQMDWEIKAAPSSEPSAGKDVVLRFHDSPNCFVEYFSDELAAYLSSGKRHPIPVQFQVTRDYGRLRSYRVLKVGDWPRELDSIRSFSGQSGPGEPPFDAR